MSLSDMSLKEISQLIRRLAFDRDGLQPFEKKD